MDPRFSRQVRFAGIGTGGQERLAGATVLIVGLGALGSRVAATLVRAGVGRAVLVDRDVVEPSNLPRQVLYTNEDADRGRPKALAAADHLARAASDTAILPRADDFTAELFAGLPRPGVIIDGTDNYPTRALINDLAVREGIPWVYGGAIGGSGTAMVVRPGDTPCLRCLLPELPATAEMPTCDTAGILAPAAEAVTAFQSMEALKILAGRPERITRGVYRHDLWEGTVGLGLARSRPDPDCPSCGTGLLPALRSPPARAELLCGRDTVQVQPPPRARVDLARLAANLEGAVESVEHHPRLLRFSAEGCRFSVFPGGRALVSGTGDRRRARVLYDRYVGAGTAP